MTAAKQPSLFSSRSMSDDGDGDHSQTTARAVASTTLALHQQIAPPGGSLAHNGAIEWTCLACVCLVINNNAKDPTQHPRIAPIALATGTKTLPYADITVGQGDLVHDSHAEVLARRAARRWLAERILVEVQQPDGHEIEGLPRVFERTQTAKDSAPFKLMAHVRVWWYISTLPCGQCSMAYTLRKLSHASEGASPPSHATASSRSVPISAVTRGRFNIARGDTESSEPILRTVPGRADAPPSLSHSCSDKLLLWSTIGWQGSILSNYLEPVRIDGLVISSDGAHEAASQQQVEQEIRHGLDISQRLEVYQSHNNNPSTAILNLAHAMRLPPSHVAPPLIHITDQTFPQSQHSTSERAFRQGIPSAELQEKVSPAWLSTNWMRPSRLAAELLRLESQSETASRRTRSRQAARKETESLVNGIKQGAPLKRSKTNDGSQTTTLPLSEKTRSRLCKLEWFRFMLAFNAALSPRNHPESSTYVMVDGGTTYAEIKGKSKADSRTSPDLESVPVRGRDLYRLRKRILRGPDLPNAAQQSIVQTWLDHVQHRSVVERLPKSDVHHGGGPAATDLQTTSGLSSPLRGWLITPVSLESFDCQGLRVEQ